MMWLLPIIFALAFIGFAVWASRARDGRTTGVLKAMSCGWALRFVLTAFCAACGA